MSKLNDFDIGELVLQLHNELKLAAEVAHVETNQVSLEIKTLTARLGKKLMNNSDHDGSTFSLNADRYPSEEDWEVEVTYDYKESKNRVAKLPGKSIQTLKINPLMHLGKRSVINIKGINTYWHHKLKSKGISTIEALAKVNPEIIRKLSIENNSLIPFDLYTKASLLNQKVYAINRDDLKDIKIKKVLEKSPHELKKIFHDRLSVPEIGELKAAVSIIWLVIDKKLAEKLTLKIFFKNGLITTN